MKFRDLFELATKATRYESFLLDEQEMKKSSKGTYYKDPNYEVHVIELDFDIGEVGMAEVVCKRPVVCSALSKLVNNNAAIKKQVFEADKNYIFDITKADQIFYTLLAKKVIKLNEGHRILKVEQPGCQLKA